MSEKGRGEERERWSSSAGSPRVDRGARVPFSRLTPWRRRPRNPRVEQIVRESRKSRGRGLGAWSRGSREEAIADAVVGSGGGGGAGFVGVGVYAEVFP